MSRKEKPQLINRPISPIYQPPPPRGTVYEAIWSLFNHRSSSSLCLGDDPSITVTFSLGAKINPLLLHRSAAHFLCRFACPCPPPALALPFRRSAMARNQFITRSIINNFNCYHHLSTYNYNVIYSSFCDDDDVVHFCDSSPRIVCPAYAYL